MSTLKLTNKQWQCIKEELRVEYPMSVFQIRSKMKTHLGFTVREHQEWVKVDFNVLPFGLSANGQRLECSIHLDFYNERKYTMFLLKYSEILHGQ